MKIDHGLFSGELRRDLGMVALEPGGEVGGGGALRNLHYIVIKVFMATSSLRRLRRKRAQCRADLPAVVAVVVEQPTVCDQHLDDGAVDLHHDRDMSGIDTPSIGALRQPPLLSPSGGIVGARTALTGRPA
ncbi:hypothetical protein JQ636_37965 [Bradyrhizobium japonicum]|uniref:hypothetical protein n=1 Tax=Bradyrhizobium japonicum TaxID=375 RepID=UPI001BA71AF4|nr:hypothetical protein [Bradyrhizobium japonicum]MBR0809350.1 hypothetical protein [Bradyrhizobium japonicum]